MTRQNAADRRPSKDPTEPIISVALGTHNGIEYLEAQLRSILTQSTTVDEIVVSDDASDDGTVELAERIVGPSPIRLVVLRNRAPLGVTANFEQALASCSGDLIALCDQDDIWHRDRIAAGVERFTARPAVDLVHSDAELVGPDGEPLGRRLSSALGLHDDEIAAERAGLALDVLLRRNTVTGATTMVRRALVQSARPFPGSWVHDEWLAVIAAVGGGVDYVDRPLIDYRQHGGNQIGASSIGLGTKLGRLRAPRTERNMRLLARAEDLATRLSQLQPGSSADESAVGKLAHERVRNALPASRLRRIPPVWREWRTGRYGRYGLGAQDVLRDLAQPV